MSIKLKNGAVFLHIPKTGGNWITAMLKELDLIDKHESYKHADIDHFFHYPNTFGRKALIKFAAQRMFHPRSTQDKPYMFCFVRNPLSWYESWFKYMEQPNRQWLFWGDESDTNNWHPNSMLNGTGQCSFPEFVRNVNAKRPGYVTELYGWYTKPQIDFIGKQEFLKEDFVEVLKIMNVNFDEEFVLNYGRVGVSPDTVKEVNWPDNLKIETALLEYAGLVRYGYQSTLEDLGIDMAHLTNKSANSVPTR